MMNDPGRQLLLNTIKIKDSINFEQVAEQFSNKYHITHVGSGSYADVFCLPKTRTDKTSKIFKVIRLLPQAFLDRLETSNTSRISPYSEAYNEYQILSTLSKLNRHVEHQRTIYSCLMFPKLFQVYLVQGQFSKYFRIKPKLIDGDESSCDDENEIDQDHYLYKNEDYEDNDSALDSSDDDYYSTDELDSPTNKDVDKSPVQIYQDVLERYNLNSVSIEKLIIVMEDCGQPIGNWLDDLMPYSALSVIKQLITGMMIAECVFQFEHRDLHSGNILLRRIDQQFIPYTVRGKRVIIPSHGFLVKIIDTTFSRIRINKKNYYKDLTYLFESSRFMTEEEMYEKQMRRQDIAYQQMYQLVEENWNNFYPKTNLFWLKYIIYKILKASIFNTDDQKQSRINVNKIEYERNSKKIQHVKSILKQYQLMTDQYSSCKELFHKILADSRLNDCCKIVFK